MLKAIQNITVSALRKCPILKKKILQFYDLYLKIAPLIIGNLIRNPAYFKNIFNSKVIAAPGTLSFGGGTFNPGALVLDENNILLLAKSQFKPWFKAIGKNRIFYLKGNPVIFLLDRTSLKTNESSVILDLIGYPTNYDYAIEDFRLFTWNDKKMINHSLIAKIKVDGYFYLKSVSSALSIFDENKKALRFWATPTLDFPLQEFEKNWVYKEKDKQLLLFYSLNPYKVLDLEDEENFAFKTIINQKLSDKINNPGGFGTMVSFSTNPIDFDDQNWLIIIHQIKHKFTGRCYFHWAILIDKASLLPVKITSKPIFSGMGARGRSPGIRYISSILKIEDEILFFAGEGDVFVTVTKKKILELQSLFVEI